MKTLIKCCLLLVFPSVVLAEDVYITDQLKAGLHEDKSLDSPIIKIVATGTLLEVVKREDRLTFVKDQSGSSGWISNDYLMSRPPNQASLLTLQTRADNLEIRLNEEKEKNIALETEMKNTGKVMPADVQELTRLKAENAELRQQFNTQKLKTGELEIELTELRKRLGQNDDVDELYSRIESLQEDRKKLEIQLANTLDRYSADGAGGLDLSAAAGNFNPGLRNMVIYLLVTLVLGLLGGAYILDLVNRRRHGGFRI